MALENTYCRKPAAKILNASGLITWIYNSNPGNGTYISGRPDGEALCHGKNFENGVPRMVFVECKADEGKLYLGNPDDPSDTSGFHHHQRSWWRQVAEKANASFCILTWIYPEREPPMYLQKNALLYLVEPKTWLALEESIKDRHNHKTAKLDEVEAHFAPCRVKWVDLPQRIIQIAKGETWQPQMTHQLSAA